MSSDDDELHKKTDSKQHGVILSVARIVKYSSENVLKIFSHSRPVLFIKHMEKS